jgi:hypothetical protein
VALRYTEEATRGTTPENNLQTLRFTSEDFRGTKETIVSDEIVGDAQIGGIFEAGYASEGTINGELSFGTYDDFFSAGIRSSAFGAATSVTNTTISADATSIVDTSAGFGSIITGQFVKVTGFGDSDLNRTYLVTTAATGTLSVYPAPASTEAAGTTVVVQGADVWNGTQKRWFSFEREHTDLSTVFQNYVGSGCGGWSISWGAGEKVNCSFNFMGNTEGTAAATIGTGTATAATTTDVMNSISDLVVMGEGATLATLTVMSGTINVSNPLRVQRVAGSTSPSGVGMGTVEVSGSLRVYLADNTLKAKVLAHTASSLAVAFEDDAGNALGFYLPSLKYARADTPTGGRDQDIVMELDFNAYKDATTGYTIHVTKMAA